MIPVDVLATGSGGIVGLVLGMVTPPFRICVTGRPGNRLPEIPALVVAMLRLEGVHERRHSEEVIAANEEHELGIG